MLLNHSFVIASNVIARNVYITNNKANKFEENANFKSKRAKSCSINSHPANNLKIGHLQKFILAKCKNFHFTVIYLFIMLDLHRYKNFDL